jgi:phage replication-related protein YjqB (UPF0714/DUF867 family)
MADRYANYAELAQGEREGIDYRIRASRVDERVAVVAPHGGYIEPGTSELTRSIAAGSWSFYCFEGLRPGRKHEELHIASERFDEPIGRALAGASQTVIGMHGRADRGDGDTVWVGGLAFALRDGIATVLGEGGFAATANPPELSGEDPSNICNRCKTGAGVQLEVPRSLRSRLMGDDLLMGAFSSSVRRALEPAIPGATRP